MKRQINSGHSLRGPTGSNRQTHERPRLPYIRNAWPDAENNRPLSAVNASIASARGCLRMMSRARVRYSGSGRVIKPDVGRSNCQNEQPSLNNAKIRRAEYGDKVWTVVVNQVR